jgi:hypothetical protein
MADIPFRIIDLIMKFKGAYSQDPNKKYYLEDIKLIVYPYRTVKIALNTVYFKKNAYKIISWDILSQMMWGQSQYPALGGGRNFMVEFGGQES